MNNLPQAIAVTALYLITGLSDVVMKKKLETVSMRGLFHPNPHHHHHHHHHHPFFWIGGLRIVLLDADETRRPSAKWTGGNI